MYINTAAETVPSVWVCLRSAVAAGYTAVDTRASRINKRLTNTSAVFDRYSLKAHRPRWEKRSLNVPCMPSKSWLGFSGQRLAFRNHVDAVADKAGSECRTKCDPDERRHREQNRTQPAAQQRERDRHQQQIELRELSTESRTTNAWLCSHSSIHPLYKYALDLLIFSGPAPTCPRRGHVSDVC